LADTPLRLTYEILAPIGAGGMGEVCRAIDTKLNRTVAIKVLSEDFASPALSPVMQVTFGLALERARRYKEAG
jgi:serine/threonine protein kinase